MFAITQVTAFIADDPSWAGLGRGLLLLAMLWWGWVAYAWLTNSTDPDRAPVRLTMFAAMAAMLVVALAVPAAFTDDAVVFGVAYLLVRVLHLVLYAVASRDDPALRRAVARLAVPLTIGPVVLLVGGFVDEPIRTGLWLLAVAVDWLGPVVGGVRGWRVHAAHFAERHSLIVIIALGESIVAAGAGAAGVDLDAGVVAAAVLAVVVAACFWWAYFDVVALVAERRLHDLDGTDQVRLARDSYMYLHFPMVAGIILFALGVKKVLGHVDEPLKAVPAIALCGGAALYLLAHVAFRLRTVGSVNAQRAVAAVLCVALVPIAQRAPGLIGLGLVAAVTTALVAYESIRLRETRRQVRAAH